MFVFFHFVEGWIQLSAIRNGLPIHYRAVSLLIELDKQQINF